MIILGKEQEYLGKFRILLLHLRSFVTGGELSDKNPYLADTMALFQLFGHSSLGCWNQDLDD